MRVCSLGRSVLRDFDSLHRLWEGMGVCWKLRVKEFGLFVDRVPPCATTHGGDIAHAGLVAILIRLLAVFGLPRLNCTAAFMAILHGIVVIPSAPFVAHLDCHLGTVTLHHW